VSRSKQREWQNRCSHPVLVCVAAVEAGRWLGFCRRCRAAVVLVADPAPDARARVRKALMR
jgi:hypothetical protein